MQSFAEHPVPHLVMVLREDKKSLGGHILRRVAVPSLAVNGVLAGVNGTFSESLSQLRNPAEIGVISVSLAGQRRVDGMMEIVIPLGIQAHSARLRRPEDASVIPVAFHDHVEF